MKFSSEEAKKIIDELNGRCVDYTTKKGCVEHLDKLIKDAGSAKNKINKMTEPKTFELEQIEKDLKAGKGKDFIEVGSRISFELINGEPATIICIGKKHDIDENEKVVNMTFAFESCLDGEFPINKTCTTQGGWKECYMNTVTLERIFRLLPKTIQELIVPVIKLSNNGNKKIEKVLNKLFLLSLNEYNGKEEDYYVLEGEGKQYELFKGGYQFKDNKYWWTRSPNAYSNSGWNYVYSIGNINYYTVYNTYYVRPCFCIN